MQYLTPLLAAASLASAAVMPRQDQNSTTTFYITGFSFAGTPHSVVSYYQLNVTDGVATSTLCSTTTNTSPEVAPFPLTGCADPWWAFEWRADNDPSNVNGTILTVTHQIDGGTNVTAQRAFGQGDVKEQEGVTPTGNTYYLDTGDSSGNFTLSAY